MGQTNTHPQSGVIAIIGEPSVTRQSQRLHTLWIHLTVPKRQLCSDEKYIKVGTRVR